MKTKAMLVYANYRVGGQFTSTSITRWIAKQPVVLNFVEHCLSAESIEVGHYLSAIEGLCSMQFGFKDVRMFFFKPKLSVLLNLIGLHYCIRWLGVPVVTPASISFSLFNFFDLFSIWVQMHIFQNVTSQAKLYSIVKLMQIILT